MKTVDARGLSCPEPVILTRGAMSGGETAYQILVDNQTARENVARYAGSQGYRVELAEKDGEYTLTVTK
jgi:TusA-related sulfurtransferase